MSQIGEHRELDDPSYDKFGHLLDPIFAANPDVDWVALGLSSQTIFTQGGDNELPSNNELMRWQVAADEYLLIYGRPIEVSDQSPHSES